MICEGKSVISCSSSQHRTCAKRGCDNVVNKRTAKYCSVTCCSSDPARNERIREQARRNRRRIIPLARQLTFGFEANAGAEAQIDSLAMFREDVPFGMARLASSW
jgi:hypothetical protein